MTQSAPQLEPSLPNQGPGDRLQAARISIGMTVEDVANKMHLSESILNSLEENNFDDITAPIFVKGYLRSYARIVRLDENEIIDQYNRFYTDGDPPISSTSNTVPEINADDARVKWVTRFVVIGLVALLSLWWWNRYQQPAQPLSLDSSGQVDPVAQGDQSAIRISPARPSSEQSSSPSALSEAARQELNGIGQRPRQIPIQPAQTQVVEVIEPAIEMVAAIDNAPSAALPTAQELDEMVSTEEQARSAPQPVDVAEPEQPAAAQNAGEPAPATDAQDLVIVVNADTWADIKDAAGERMVRDLLRAGRTLSVSGEAPIQVFLGNGYGVSMTYKGKDFDIGPYIKPNNTARFRLGQ